MHTDRYMPIAETPEEEAAVRAALTRWDDDFYLVGEHASDDDGRASTEDLPAYVAALVPPVVA